MTNTNEVEKVSKNDAINIISGFDNRTICNYKGHIFRYEDVTKAEAKRIIENRINSDNHDWDAEYEREVEHLHDEYKEAYESTLK